MWQGRWEKPRDYFRNSSTSFGSCGSAPRRRTCGTWPEKEVASRPIPPASAAAACRWRIRCLPWAAEWDTSHRLSHCSSNITMGFSIHPKLRWDSKRNTPAPKTTQTHPTSSPSFRFLDALSSIDRYSSFKCEWTRTSMKHKKAPVWSQVTFLNYHQWRTNQYYWHTLVIQTRGQNLLQRWTEYELLLPIRFSPRMNTATRLSKGVSQRNDCFTFCFLCSIFSIENVALDQIMKKIVMWK